MGAKDLRLNNLVEMGQEGIGSVSGYNLYQLTVKENGVPVADYYHNWNPIPLTEDWLVNKFDFEDWGVVEVNQYEKYQRFVLRNVVGGTSNFEVHIIESNYGGQYFKEILYSIDNDEPQRFAQTTYVHNLQNGFYFLTGQELELKQTTEVNQ